MVDNEVVGIDALTEVFRYIRPNCWAERENKRAGSFNEARMMKTISAIALLIGMAASVPAFAQSPDPAANAVAGGAKRRGHRRRYRVHRDDPDWLRPRCGSRRGSGWGRRRDRWRGEYAAGLRAATGRALNRNVFALLNIEMNAGKCVCLNFIGVENLLRLKGESGDRMNSFICLLGKLCLFRGTQASESYS